MTADPHWHWSAQPMKVTVTRKPFDRLDVALLVGSLALATFGIVFLLFTAFA